MVHSDFLLVVVTEALYQHANFNHLPFFSEVLVGLYQRADIPSGYWNLFSSVVHGVKMADLLELWFCNFYFRRHCIFCLLKKKNTQKTKNVHHIMSSPQSCWLSNIYFPRLCHVLLDVAKKHCLRNQQNQSKFNCSVEEAKKANLVG